MKPVENDWKTITVKRSGDTVKKLAVIKKPSQTAQYICSIDLFYVPATYLYLSNSKKRHFEFICIAIAFAIVVCRYSLTKHPNHIHTYVLTIMSGSYMSYKCRTQYNKCFCLKNALHIFNTDFECIRIGTVRLQIIKQNFVANM
jgi:hypothetical protein